MPAPVHGYAISPADSARLTADAQLALIDDYCAARGWSLGRRFIDVPESAWTAWLDRPAGSELAALLAPGVKIIAAGPESIYTSAGEMLAVVKALQDRGAALHMATTGTERHPRALSTEGIDGAMMETVLTLMLDLGKASHGDAVSRGMERRRLAGLKYCHYAGYGCTWRGRKGQERRQPDAYEREAIAAIAQWRKDFGWSFEAIALHLLRNRITTAEGRDWSPSRVRRAYLAWAL